MKLSLVFILLLACSFGLPAQNTKNYIDDTVDSYDTHHLYDPNEITYVITADFKTDSEKVRAIFYWITQNIAYDCNEFHTGIILPRNDDFEDALLTKTLRTRKGICCQYAQLFAYMCNLCNIKAEVITGYTSDHLIWLHKLMGSGAENHAWNAVCINNRWYLLDVTFASGYCNGRVTHFTRCLDNMYYLTSPTVFIMDHHPVDIEWELFAKPLRFSPWVTYVMKAEKAQMHSQPTSVALK